MRTHLARAIAFVGSALALACVSSPPAFSTFPARKGAVWSEDCCGDPVVKTEPAVPADSVPSGQSGWVVVSGILDERGWVTEPLVLAAEPEGLFDAAALKAFDGWRYAEHSEPGMRREVRAVISFGRPRRQPTPVSGSGGGGMSGGGGGGGY